MKHVAPAHINELYVLVKLFSNQFLYWLYAYCVLRIDLVLCSLIVYMSLYWLIWGDLALNWETSRQDGLDLLKEKFARYSHFDALPLSSHMKFNKIKRISGK